MPPPADHLHESCEIACLGGDLSEDGVAERRTPVGLHQHAALGAFGRHHQPPVHSTSVSVLAGRIGIEEVETAVLRRDLARRTGPYAFQPLSGVHAAFVVRAETPAASGST